ncbi:MAG: CBU_0592 family membrane protein [Rickettsiales bacterium]
MEMLLTSIGLLGVAISLGAYGLLTRGVFTQHDPRYYWMNIAGTIFIGLSLIVQWNIGAAVSQVLWIVISLVGLARAYRRRV